ncbi:tRNA uridine-5-carboxymethylaminomethyl(34) synthesis enzyme MnmG [Sphingomonas sp.]|uniref:tRNA uridine-5-carboxymethylaminomethyl(34) synthesis enzyme MnmG n=1 Tax=Sphingomonas sp. TaxID=28214 RepID=UPI00286AA06C|nr:tRNA uridine-5-carboxymethylaminomethyl(34) synthesis enzyme MnmG [Sphingomonas sp.]
MFDILVIGAGHAGCEAAAAAARRGARVGLITFRAEDIGQMSCNPSIGGVGKGHLVRELDVFDGLMARAADQAAIHRRMLNRSKGSAVHGPRVQADRALYQAAMQAAMRATGLTIIVGEAEEVLIGGGRVSGLRLSGGQEIKASAIVIATGTFLDAKLFCGMQQVAGGRRDERAAVPLAHQLREWGVAQGRLKTGTPPRLDGRTIDWARLAPQPSDVEAWSMSALPLHDGPPQLACAITRTNAATHELIAANFDRSPLFAGAIEGRGPRYCPSIEDKIRRFGDRDGHQIFLEPEGLTSALVYPNGISTSLPADVQQRFVNSIDGLERARIIRPGYAVDYEYADARKLGTTLEHSSVPGLFLSGQINGTTGYEEAASQGLAAGLNAAASALGIAPHRFDRRSSYIGVMIDDLTLQGVTEPYRMMTARAEYRLSLRADNATTRLGGEALAMGISTERQRQIEAHLVDRAGPDWAATAEGQADEMYAPYVERQDREWAALHRDRTIRIPAALDFATVAGLSNESVERLSAARPETIDQASRIAGITPAALAVLHFASVRRAA